MLLYSAVSIRGKILLFYAVFVLALAGCTGNNAVEPGFDALILEARQKMESGECSDAQLFALRALVLSRVEKNLLHEAVALKTCGNFFLRQCQDIPDSAAAYYDKAAEILDAIAGEYQKGDSIPAAVLVEQANVQNNIALLRLNERNYDKAIIALQKVLKADKNLANVTGQAKTLLNIGRAYREYGIVQRDKSIKDARDKFSKSLDFFNESFLLQPAAAVLLNKARTFQELEQFDSALAQLSWAGSMYTSEKNHLWAAITKGNAGFLLADMAALTAVNDEARALRLRAIDSLYSAIQGIEKLRGDLANELQRAAFFDDKVFYYEKLLALLYAEGRHEEAFALVEKAKARSLLDQLATKELSSLQSYSEESKVLIGREKELRLHLGKVQFIPDSSEIAAGLFSEYEEVLARLKNREPGYAALRTSSPVSISELQAALSDSAVVLEYFMGRSFSAVFLVSRDTLLAREIVTSSAAAKVQYSIADTIEKMRDEFIEFTKPIGSLKERLFKETGDTARWREVWDSTVTPRQFQYTLFNLYQYLIGDAFTKVLKNKTLVYVVPHGILHHLPFGALISNPLHLDYSKQKHVVRPKYWLEEKYIVNLPSASLFTLLKKNIRNAVNSALIIGNPVYPSKNWTNLDGALAEANQVASHFTDTLVLRRGDATEKRVKEVIGKYDIIHFATHGQFEENALASKIVLSKSEGEDGYLTANEIFDLNLSASLVVLSACQSGQIGGFTRGKGSSGDDLVGLTRAFLFAGTPSVIATLWFVDDKSTSAAMMAFYDALKGSGLNKVAALRTAQLAVLNNGRNHDWSHPYFWAPFIYLGAF